MCNSDSEEENVIRFGTPLDPFEEDEIPSKRKFQQPPEQYAVDAQGRRRFHGAFTGGFSAGFGNTVGTPEGWTPTSFKSSRTEKAQVSNLKPEDFMDDEDRSEFGIAPRHMQTQSDFSGQKRPRQKQFHDGPIPGQPVLEQLVRAVHETAAVRILRKMGWREGQGAGDRLTKREKRRAKEQHKVYGCYMPPDMRQDTQPESEGSSDSEFDFDTLFAPDDYEPYILTRKNDRFGLGYSGLSRHSVLGNLVGEYGNEGSSKSHLRMKEKGKKVSIRGQAFGVGAFENDDEDIYATEDMSHYDFTLGGVADDAQKKKKTEKSSNVLEGFVRSSKPLPPVPSYPPPALPRDYTPLAAGARRSRFEPSTAPQRDQGLGRHELTAEARGALLGETPLPKTQTQPVQPTQSIQNTKEDPITKLLGRNVNFVSNNEPKELNYIPITDSGKEITTVFKPFVNDPQKQMRYERYVQDKERYKAEREADMDRLKEWERDREMVEFEQAAKLYKPLTGVMGDRFTHAAEPDDGPVNPLCAVTKSSISYGLATPEQIDAATQGLYGVMTRRETAWRPEILLCKRFNVPEPGVTKLDPKKDDKPKVSYSIFSYLETSVHDKESFAKEQTKFSGSKSVTDKTNKITDNIKTNTNQENDVRASTSTDTGFPKRLTVAELFLKESEKDLVNKEQSTVTETIDKFDKMDLYKSIFLSDSETEEAPKVEEHRSINFEEFIDMPRNIERNESPPRGIFANIDFDEINSWKRNTENIPGNSKSHNDTNKDKVDINKEDKNIEKAPETEEADIYGPKIPENLKIRLESEPSTHNFRPLFRSKSEINKDLINIDSSSSDSWVDVKEVNTKKMKKKKSKKHKSKHKKSKHKKKDR